MTNHLWLPTQIRETLFNFLRNALSRLGRPLLPRSVASLRDRFAAKGRWDLSSIICVLPGSRAVQRLQALLRWEAEEHDLDLQLPQILTVGQLPELLYRAKSPIAFTTRNILRILSLDFTKWVLLANLIAWPLTWWTMKKWLEGFAYRIDIPYWVFAVAGIMAFIIALATVSFHAIRASRQNPGISLRYE